MLPRLLTSICLLLCVSGRARSQDLPKSAAGPDATVTFYTSSARTAALDVVRNILPGNKHDLFTGYLFDSQLRMLKLEWPQYVTLRLPAGVHTFSASLSKKHAAANSQTTLLLEPGKSYAFLVEEQHAKLELLMVPLSQMAAVPIPLHAPKGNVAAHNCAELDRALQLHVELKAKYVDMPFRDRIVPGKPSCPAATAAEANATPE